MKNKKKIIIKIYGGLGNQMFQYAAGRALSLWHQVPLCINIEWFNTKQNSTIARIYQLNIFKNITAPIQKSSFFPCQNLIKPLTQYLSLSHTIREPHFAYWPAFSRITQPAMLVGYWQSEKYFENFQNEILHDFTFPALPKKAEQLSKEIAKTPESVSVHIRRGDYISNPQAQAFHGNLQHDYYNKALQTIKYSCGNTKLFIFSDDPQWARQNFDCCGHDAVIVDLNFPTAPHHDMHLMSLCKHHIIANSSFSWWGAWLGNNRGLTIAPKKWFAQKAFDEYKDVYCKDWIVL